MKNRRRQTGFSMIEVLVTFLLITIGILGMIALQGRAIGYTQDSVQRNTAAMLADDLLELMRSNLNETLGANGLPNATSGYYKAKGADFGTVTDANCNTTSTTASRQLACWAREAARRLPGAGDILNSEFYICRSAAVGTCSANGSAIEIQLAWKVKSGECLDNSAAADSDLTICRYRLRSEL